MDNPVTKEHSREIGWMIDRAVSEIIDYANTHRLDMAATAEAAENRVRWKMQ
ncbi:MAG: hypothetical protein WC976_06615 [Caldisericia bacterium]